MSFVSFIDTIYTNRFATCDQECPILARILVQKFNGRLKHIVCAPRGSSFLLSLAPNKTDIDTILDLHNNARSIVSPTATSMSSVKWDARLARLAQIKTEQCNLDNACTDCQHPLNFGSFRRAIRINWQIYWDPIFNIGNSYYASSDQDFNWYEAINVFLSSKQYFSYGASNNEGLFYIFIKKNLIKIL